MIGVPTPQKEAIHLVVFAFTLQTDGFDLFAVSGAGRELVLSTPLDYDQMARNAHTFYLLNLTALVSISARPTLPLISFIIIK